MKLTLRVLAAVIGLSSTLADAKVVSLPGDNFSIDVPADWGPVQFPAMPEHCRVATSGRSPNDNHFYDVMITDTPSHGAPEAFLTGMQKPMVKMGWTASEIRDMTINGIPFAVFTMTREANQPPFMLLATTFTKENVYTIQIGLPSGSVETAPELNAIVQSFQFLKPVESFSRHDQVIGDKAYQIGYTIGRNLGRVLGVLLVAVFLLFLFFRSLKSNR